MNVTIESLLDNFKFRYETIWVKVFSTLDFKTIFRYLFLSTQPWKPLHSNNTVVLEIIGSVIHVRAVISTARIVEGCIVSHNKVFGTWLAPPPPHHKQLCDVMMSEQHQTETNGVPVQCTACVYCSNLSPLCNNPLYRVRSMESVLNVAVYIGGNVCVHHFARFDSLYSPTSYIVRVCFVNRLCLLLYH